MKIGLRRTPDAIRSCAKSRLTSSDPSSGQSFIVAEGSSESFSDLDAIMVTVRNGLLNRDYRSAAINPRPRFSWETFTSM